MRQKLIYNLRLISLRNQKLGDLSRMYSLIGRTIDQRANKFYSAFMIIIKQLTDYKVELDL